MPDSHPTTTPATPVFNRTREERDALRRRLSGSVGALTVLIPEAVAEQILEDIKNEHLWFVTAEEYPGGSLRVYVAPLMSAKQEPINAALNRLSAKYGNAPYLLATEFTMYRLCFQQM